MRCEIVYEDGEILVIHKPAGLATQSASVGQPDAVSELKGYLARTSKSLEGAEKNGTGKPRGSGQTPYLGVIHRLDQPVEGLLVFAKTPKAAAGLSGQLGSGSLNKTYLAAIYGRPPKEDGELTDFLRKDGGGAMVVTGREKDYPEAKRAVLRYHLEREEDGFSVLRIRIETGRFHQIRAQLSHAGMPILGDRKYGFAASQELADKLGIKNVALCACLLECRHPVTGKTLSFTCEPSWKKIAFDRSSTHKIEKSGTY